MLAAGLVVGGCGSDGCTGDACRGPGGGSGEGGSGGTGGSAGSGGAPATGGSSGEGGSGGAGGSDVTEIELRVEDYIVGLERPWDIGWLPNETVLVTERPGNLKIFVNGADAAPTVIPIDDVVSTGGEGGLMGLEVDPEFASNGYVYVCMASSAGPANDVRVVRLTMSRPNADAIEDRTDIVTGMPHNDGSRGRHSGCRPRFGPDGFLWVGTGDAAIGTTPQDDNSLGGKVLRIDRDGNAAPDNPNGRLWYSKGHRNIQGMAFRSDGIRMSAEHGPDVDDEINALLPGNFGWNPVPGYNESVPMTDTQEFPDAIEAAWSTGRPTLALSGATFIEGDQWGNWNGTLAVATLKASHLHVFDVDEEGNVTSRGRFVEDQGRLRAVSQGSDGLLYITTDRRTDGDRVLRVTPVPVR
jgi:glucose/arabinose dehydrogenase